MKDVGSLTLSTMRFWYDLWSAQTAAMTTIALRLPIVTADPQGREAQKMVSEKVAAASEGALAGSAAATRAFAAVAAGAGPVAGTAAMLEVARAVSRPAHRRVEANAKRLSRRRKKL